MSNEQKQNDLPKSIIGFLDKYGERLWEGVKSLYKAASDEARINWQLGYERYLNKASARNYFVKTFLSTNDPRPLYDVYVPLNLSCGRMEIKKVGIKELIEINKFSVITATGGSGKTMTMRHLFLDTLKNTHFVPVFIELREINNTNFTLYEFIEKKLKDNAFDFDKSYIRKAFEAGHFALLLDGFDEVSNEKREMIARQIEEIAETFHKTVIILSSRPDYSLNQWKLFHVWRVLPLSLQLACELVANTDAETKIKEKFSNDLKKELFRKHKSFLSNPLLLSIMLITYENTGNIPHKISTFYERAYTALFEQHDARKAYHRIKRTNLDILGFKKVFSAFCFLTFLKNTYNFSETEIFEYLEKAKKISSIDFELKDFLHDSIQAVCLLVREGLDVTFSHRSFQEYFAAYYNSQLNDSNTQREFFLKQIKAFSGESLDLSFEISPECVEENLIIPYLKRLEDELNFEGSVDPEMYKKIMRRMYTGFFTPEEKGERKIAIIINSDDDIYEIFSFIQTHYLGKKTYDSLNKSSKLREYLLSRENHHVDLLEAFSDKEVLEDVMEGNYWYSKQIIEDTLNVNNSIIEKHETRKNLLRLEILDGR